MNKATLDGIRCLYQKNQKYKIDIDFLDRTWRVIGTIQGTTRSFDLSIDSESEIRRTLSLTVNVTDSNMVEPENMIWTDKYVKVNLGVYDYKKGKYMYYKMGRYVITSYEYSFDGADAQLKLSLADLMALFTDDRGNQITTKSSIPVGVTIYPCPICRSEMTHNQITSEEIVNIDGEYSYVSETIDTYECPDCGFKTNIRPNSIVEYADITNALKATINRFSPLPYNRFSLENLQRDVSEVPYDLDYDIGTYPIEIITALRDLYPNYQTYFDTDGVFVFSSIPTEESDYVVIDKDVMDKILISENTSGNFGEICNVHDVWGQSLSADRTALKTDVSNYNDTSIYYLNFDGLSCLENNKTYSFTPPQSNNNVTYVVIQSKTENFTSQTMPLYIKTGDCERKVKSGELIADVPYVLKVVMYKENGNIGYKCILQGELQIRGIVKTVTKEQSEESIQIDKNNYACNNIYYKVEPDNVYAADKIGEYIRVCSGGDYDNIYTTQLAYERGRYENYKTTRLNHKATISTLIVPWLDVNQIIRYTSPVTGEVKKYLIKSINISIQEGIMTMNLSEFYPYYPSK